MPASNTQAIICKHETILFQFRPWTPCSPQPVGILVRLQGHMIWLLKNDFTYLWRMIKDSLAPGKCGCHAKLVIFKFISGIDIFSISCGNTLKWIPQYG